MAPLPKIKTPPVAAFDEAAIRAHCAMLHSLADGINGVLVSSVFFANTTGGADVDGAVSHHAIGDVDGTVEAIMAHASTAGANCYIGLQVMRRGLGRGKRGTEADIVAVLGLVADMDSDKRMSGSLPLDANLVLETSPGNQQPFILFDRPIPPAEAKPLAAALKRATGSDHGTADIAHVWRIPGCLNWPNKKKLERGRSIEPVTVIVQDHWDGTLTSVEELRGALEPWSGPAAAAASVTLGELPSVNGIAVTENASVLLAACDVGDRSEHAARVVEQLAFDGYTAEQAASLFLSSEGDWFHRYTTEQRAQKDFARLWGKFGVPLIEEREAQAERGKQFAAAMLSKRSVPAPANDNIKPNLSDTPNMHPSPFTPEAAGGLLAEIATWVNSTAIVPVPELSLAAAIALLGGCFGKKAIGPTNAGVNIYFCTLLATAGGKGHPPKAIRALGDLCGAQGAVSNGDPTSYAAIERMLRKSISTVAVLDEFGILLQDINGRNQNSASASIRKMLLAIFDQSNSVFDGRIYASSETKKDDGPLIGPALTVLAMTTPSTLYAGLSAASVSDGFINRFVFVTGSRDEDGVRVPSLDVDLKPPASLVAALHRAITQFPKPPAGATKAKIPFEGGEHGEAYKRWGEIFLWQHRRGWDEVYNDINGRAAENTVRLAAIRAIGRDAGKPSISLDDVEWAWAVVYRSIELIASGVSRHMSSSPAEALRKCIVEILREAPDHTIAYSALLRRKGVRGSDLREVDGALQYLIESDEIRILGKPKPGAGSKFQLLDLATETAT
ncbi:hypothetical protein ILFOPFJJ_01476 [Ensifer psoraleae]|uniref:DUF3987 domain-containing protein n=1 Tax=Sinorhizobium psoraleae TaxID=520838 RepID=UPI00156A2AF2|nr:DNA-primase RepB domain-containing protein [Sinorhizobium psoraleae]NRP70595.1 hypothetical protein [Sinorhizobium psoraleae]